MLSKGGNTPHNNSNSETVQPNRPTMLTAAFLLSLFASLALTGNGADYGVDCSFPIHSKEIKCPHGVLGDRQKFYEEFMEECRIYHGSKAARCDQTEEDRIAMNNRQPQSMVVSAGVETRF